MWKGCDWLPSHDDSKDAMILVEHRALERRVAAMDSELRKALKEIKRLNKQMADLYSDAKEMDDDTTNWFEEMKKTLEMTDENPAKTQRQQPANTIENMVAQAWS